jgi:hypothetical protein
MIADLAQMPLNLLAQDGIASLMDLQRLLMCVLAEI